ncbi:MAG TPA: hypothetical protein VFA21_14690 [Pyrinomonadaceae bacterium]|nr:hypothetical protein [Pyrinomonadaceae bacterium]
MKRKFFVFAVTLALLGSSVGASAQEQKRPAPPPDGSVVVVTTDQNGSELTTNVHGGGDTFVFVGSEMSFDGKVVRGAPYSAQAVTESVQTLADGNRIVRKTTAQVYRDSEGRTRRDQTLGTIGPYAAAGDPPQTFFINDPVGGFTYILDPASKVARKMARIELNFKTEPGGAEKAIIERRLSGGAAAGAEKSGDAKVETSRNFVFTAPAAPPDGPGLPKVEFYGFKMADSKTEKLAPQNIEGVQAEGTRVTETIPAGDIGNEQPIQIVNETWYSPELQVVVMTRHSDPRFGETTYKLTGIQRVEPSPTLFQVPPDYTVKDGPTFGIRNEQRRVRLPDAPKSPEN